jgi:hypothetical protein
LVAKKFTARQFIAAIPGSGGVVSQIAAAVGCDWHTARRYIDNHATVKEAWDAERHSITDKARHNILKAIDKGDLMMSKWWLQVMDDEFVPRSKSEHAGKDGGPLVTIIEYVNDWRHPDADSTT